MRLVNLNNFVIREALAKARIISPCEKTHTIQSGYRKCGTHARVFSQTHTHGNSKNEIRQRKGRSQEERSEYETK